jgi:hypothetical protein
MSRKLADDEVAVGSADRLPCLGRYLSQSDALIFFPFILHSQISSSVYYQGALKWSSLENRILYAATSRGTLQGME